MCLSNPEIVNKQKKNDERIYLRLTIRRVNKGLKKYLREAWLTTPARQWKEKRAVKNPIKFYRAILLHSIALSEGEILFS